MTEEEQEQVKRKMRGAQSNALGHWFEQEIMRVCEYYRKTGGAFIEKTPENFRVLSKQRDGRFSGRFVGNAQPDFKGTLKGGRAIVFDAKFTTKDRIEQSVLTDAQTKALETHHQLGALAGVCVGMKSGIYLIPWQTWRDMKEIFGRKYMTETELSCYKF
jgi:recombination protein U